MPWRRTDPVQEREKFVVEARRGLWSMTELCERYGISRKTGYVWLNRFEEEGRSGLEERSRRPRVSPNATDPAVVEMLLRERRRHPHWGPKKLLARLRRRAPELDLPARSTVCLILKRHGLVEARRRRRRAERPFVRPLGALSAPNQVWTADYKGQFRMRRGRLCYPLTIADGYSRYLLRCEGCSTTRTGEAWPVFEAAFREFGLPERLRTDNGMPFGTKAVAGLSQLSVWWLKLGIRVERIEPAHPEQNGQHERMHRTLKKETTRPPGESFQDQQEIFDRFRREYNEIRPHEALDDRVPAELYWPSPRAYSGERPGLDYPAHFERRQVRVDGAIKWRGRFIFVSEVLSGEPVGLEESEDGVWSLYFGPVLLGRISETDPKLAPGGKPLLTPLGGT